MAKEFETNGIELLVNEISKGNSNNGGDEKQIIAGYPAPPEFAAQIYAQALLPNLVARVTQGGESFDDAISWAENEAELVSRG